MKVKLKNISRSEFARLRKKEYSVLGYGYFGENLDSANGNFSFLYLILDDDNRITTIKESLVEITDQRLSNYIERGTWSYDSLFEEPELKIIEESFSDYTRRDDLNYSSMLYLRNDFNESVNQFKTSSNNYWYSIWNLDKNIELFKLAGYDISNYYYESICDEQYKVNLIQNLLTLLNEFMDPEPHIGHYHEEYLFYEKDKLEVTVDEKLRKDMIIKNLDETQYEKLLRDFISDGLRSKIENENKYTDYENQLFYLISYITSGKVQSINRIETHYDDCFVMEHENKFYTLNKSWWG